MPKYHLEHRTRDSIAARVSMELPGHEALRIELARFAGELLRDHAAQVWQDEDWRIDVTDERGLILYAMQISAFETPATRT